MKATTLLSAAALATACVGSAFGAVTSQNIVGYIKLPLTAGYNLIANQLNNGDNTVQTLFSSLPADGFTTVYKWNGHGYDSANYQDPVDGWDNPALAVGPGDGLFVYVQAAQSVTLVGEVSLSTTVNVINGYSLVASPIPVEGDLTDTNTINFPTQVGDTVYTWTGKGFHVNGYPDVIDGWDDGAPPHIIVGQGFFVNGAARTWTRTFSVQ